MIGENLLKSKSIRVLSYVASAYDNTSVYAILVIYPHNPVNLPLFLQTDFHYLNYARKQVSTAKNIPTIITLIIL